MKSLSCVWLFVTSWTVAYQASQSLGFSRQEYWSGLPFPSPGDLPNPGIEPRSPKLQADALLSEPPERHNTQEHNTQRKMINQEICVLMLHSKRQAPCFVNQDFSHLWWMMAFCSDRSNYQHLQGLTTFACVSVSPFGFCQKEQSKRRHLLLIMDFTHFSMSWKSLDVFTDGIPEYL